MRFREAELRNRIMLQKVLGAGQIKENPFDTVLMEHLFALKTPASTALVSRETTGALAYTHGEKPLFSCSPGGRKITAAESRQFVRFLRYQYPVHPDILTEFEKRNVVPEKLEVHHYNMQSDHFTFVLVKSSTVARSFDASALIDGLKKNESDVQPVCALADAMSQDQFKAKCDELVRAAVAEGQAKRHLECIVLFLEYALSSGQPLPQEFQTFRADLQADPTVKAFFGAMNPKDKESAQKAADLMKTLRAGATSHVNVGEGKKSKRLLKPVQLDPKLGIMNCRGIADGHFKSIQQPAEGVIDRHSREAAREALKRLGL